MSRIGAKVAYDPAVVVRFIDEHVHHFWDKKHLSKVSNWRSGRVEAVTLDAVDNLLIAYGWTTYELEVWAELEGLTAVVKDETLSDSLEGLDYLEVLA